MDKEGIEREARRLQYEIYIRAKLRSTGVPDIPILFDPRAVADHCNLFFELREQLNTDYRGGGEAAGIWQRDRSTILVSARYSYATQRWTAAHEIGHFMLHPHVGDRTYHRELPIDAPRGSRPQLEREADYFATCLLMPGKAVISEFNVRFGTKHPLALTETVAFHLKLDQLVFAEPPGSLKFAIAVAKAHHFDRNRFNGSLAGFFGVSPTAMAIRLHELGLVSAYLYA